MRLVFFLIAFFMFMHTGFSNPQEDNINDAYPEDTARINQWIGEVKKILYIYPDSSSAIINRILDLSAKHDYHYGLFNAYNLRANSLIMSGLNREAIGYLKKGFEHCDTLSNPRGKAVLLINLGFAHMNLSNTDSAIYYYNQTYQYALRHNIKDLRNKVMYDLGLIHLDRSDYLNAYKNLVSISDTFYRNKDTLLQILSYGSLGVLYAKLGNFDSSYVYYLKANELDLSYNLYDNMVNSYNNIGELFFRLKHDYDSALFYYRKSMNYRQKLNKNYYKSSVHINIGNVYYENEIYDSAYYYYALAESDSLTAYFPEQHAAVMINIGEYYRIINNNEQSRPYLQKGLAIAETNGFIGFLSVGYLSLSRLDSSEGRWAGSLHHFKKHKTFSDSLARLADQNEVSKLALANYISKQTYDNQLLIKENDLKAELIRNQKILLYGSMVALLSVIVVLVILFLNRRRIKKLHTALSDRHTELEKLAIELKASNDKLSIEQKNLEEANITKDKFLSILSHDLRGPFHSLLGMLQLMDDDWTGFSDEEKKDHIHSLFLSSQKTSELLEDILTWGKSQQGKLDARADISRLPENQFPIWCPKCDYLLRGLPDGRCPECGTEFERARLLVQQR